MKRIISEIIIFLLFMTLTGCQEDIISNNEEHKELTILFPKGGESFYVNDTINISWQSKNIDFLDVNYSINDGQTWLPIAKNVEAMQNYYEWIVPNISSSKNRISFLHHSPEGDSLQLAISDIFSISENTNILNDLSIYPLHVNDIWVYKVRARLQSWAVSDLSDDQCNFEYLLKCRIDTVVNFEGIEFYRTSYENFFPDTVYKNHHAIDNHPIGGWYNTEWIGVDSSNAKVYNYYPTIPSKTTLYNLSMKLNEVLDIDLNWEFGDISVPEVGNDNIFDQNRKYKIFKMTHAYFETNYKYVSGIGIYSGKVAEEYANGDFYLEGCVINNIVYGDTSTVL